MAEAGKGFEGGGWGWGWGEACCWIGEILLLLLLGFRMSKAIARSGVIRVWERGISSSGDGSSSSHLENQLESSSLILPPSNLALPTPNSLFLVSGFFSSELILFWQKYQGLNNEENTTTERKASKGGSGGF